MYLGWRSRPWLPIHFRWDWRRCRCRNVSSRHWSGRTPYLVSDGIKWVRSRPVGKWWRSGYIFHSLHTDGGILLPVWYVPSVCLRGQWSVNRVSARCRWILFHWRYPECSWCKDSACWALVVKSLHAGHCPRFVYGLHYSCIRGGSCAAGWKWWCRKRSGKVPPARKVIRKVHWAWIREVRQFLQVYFH